MPELPGRSGWDAALDILEQRALEAAARQEPLSPWRAPEAAGALPSALADRAEEVLAAQRRAIAILETEEHKVAALVRALNKVPQPFAGDTPVYVDTVG